MYPEPETQTGYFPGSERYSKTRPERSGWWRNAGVHLVLFLATILTTVATGGIVFSASILSILFVHEMGHYLMSRRYGVPATLPYFIPFPHTLPFTNILLNPFGTMGAVIQMRGLIPDRKALFDIGAAGPIAGFFMTVPLLLYGISHSTVITPEEANASFFVLGDSLLFKFCVWCFHGTLAEGMDLMLHPSAYAAWAGLLVTAINLMPIGQLDGGHVLYSVFGPKTRRIYLVVIGLLGGMVLFYSGWALLFLILLWFGRKHPPPMNDFVPINRGRKVLAVVLLFILVISFIPVPFQLL